MQNYHLELVIENGDSINTVVTNLNEGCSREEIWRFNGETWIWENGWSTNSMEQGLYDILDRNDVNTDSILNELCKIGVIEFSR